MIFYKKISIAVLAFAFVIQNVFAALIGFTANVQIDLPNLESEIYILSGSAADSITFSDNYDEVIIQIPAGSTFKLGSSSTHYLSVTPLSESVTLSFHDSSLNSSGYIQSWALQSSVATQINMMLYVPENSKNFKIFANNNSIGEYFSSANGLLSFTDTLNGSKSYSFVRSDLPSGASAGNDTTTQPVRLPPSSGGSTSGVSDLGTLAVQSSVTLAPTTGEVTQAVKLYDVQNHALTVEIQKDTKVTTADGKAFASIIATPKTIPAADVEGSFGGGGSGSNKVYAAVNVDTRGQNVFFDRLAKISIPIDISKVTNPAKLKAFYYNKNENKYKLAGDGGKLSADKKTFEVEVSHFTLFAVIESDLTEIDMINSDAQIYTDIAEADSALHGAAGQFADVDSAEWFAPFVSELAAKKIVSGYPDGNFKPAAQINRAEIVKIAATAFDIPTNPTVTVKPFPDVAQSQWFTPFVAAAKTAGVVSGDGNNLFRPSDPVNRAEALKILLLASGLELPQKVSVSKFPDVAYNQWFTRFVNFAEANGIVNGFSDGNFRPGAFMNRAEAAKIVSLLLGLKAKSTAAITPATELSFWEKLLPKNLFGNLLSVFE